MATSFDLYIYYLALKSHFTRDSYDYFKYGGKVSASNRSFEGRRDKYFFDKLAKRRDAREFLLANVVEDPRRWIGDIVNGEGSESTYTAWAKRNQSLTYVFTDELGKLDDAFDDNFQVEQGTHPLLLKLYLRKQISLETLIILIHMTGCYAKWQKRMEYDPIWAEIAMKVRKYQPFLKYDIAKLKKIVVDKFS